MRSGAPFATMRKLVVPRISDVYAALPAITGKLELEYEGEMKGADHVGRELIRAAIAKTYDEYFTGANMQQIVQWFDLGGEIQLPDSAPAARSAGVPERHSRPDGQIGPLGVFAERQSGSAGLGRRICPRGPARAQAHRTQRRTRVQGGREKARSGAREIV